LDFAEEERAAPRCRRRTAAAPVLAKAQIIEAAAMTRKATDGHHVWYRALDQNTVVEIPEDVHAALTGLWRKRCEVLKEPGSDPLHRIAAAVVTIGEAAAALADYARRNRWPAWFVEIAELFAERATSIAHWLLCLAGRLADRHGPDWSLALDMPQWSPPANRSGR
jgi:hypothetical protein